MYISKVFSNGDRILTQYRSRLLLHYCGDIDVSSRRVMDQHGR